jgi:hypothetical protein
MDGQDERIVGLLQKMQVGDTLRIRMEKGKVGAEVRDRVSLVLTTPTEDGAAATLEGFTKDAGGMWDLESLTGAKDNPIVEVILRRAASDL